MIVRRVVIVLERTRSIYRHHVCANHSFPNRQPNQEAPVYSPREDTKQSFASVLVLAVGIRRSKIRCMHHLGCTVHSRQYVCLIVSQMTQHSLHSFTALCNSFWAFPRINYHYFLWCFCDNNVVSSRTLLKQEISSKLTCWSCVTCVCVLASAWRQ